MKSVPPKTEPSRQPEGLADSAQRSGSLPREDAGKVFNLHALYCVVFAAVIFWNFWIPTAVQYYNTITPEIGKPNWDFYAYYIAGKAFDQGLDPYVDNSAASSALSDVRIPGFSRYIYPPTLLPLYRVLAHQSYSRARLIWAAAVLVLYVSGCLLLLSAVTRRSRAMAAAIFLLLLVTSHPLLVHIRFGQIDALVGSLIFITLACHVRKQFWLSAFALALATWIKINPAFLLIYFVIYRRSPSYLAWYIVSLAVILTISLRWVPLNYYGEFARVVLPNIGLGAHSQYNQSITKIISAHWLIRILPPLGISSLVLLAIRSGRPPSGGCVILGAKTTLADLTFFMLNILAILLFSPICWMMNYVWVVPVMAILLAGLYMEESWTAVSLLFGGVCLMNAFVHKGLLLDSLNLWGNLMTSPVLLYLLGVQLRRRPEAKRVNPAATVQEPKPA